MDPREGIGIAMFMDNGEPAVMISDVGTNTLRTRLMG